MTNNARFLINPVLKRNSAVQCVYHLVYTNAKRLTVRLKYMQKESHSCQIKCGTCYIVSSR